LPLGDFAVSAALRLGNARVACTPEVLVGRSCGRVIWEDRRKERGMKSHSLISFRYCLLHWKPLQGRMGAMFFRKIPGKSKSRQSQSSPREGLLQYFFSLYIFTIFSYLIYIEGSSFNVSFITVYGEFYYGFGIIHLFTEKSPFYHRKINKSEKDFIYSYLRNICHI
jgi:hypothetical protein